jgi:hypothetical protein
MLKPMGKSIIRVQHLYAKDIPTVRIPTKSLRLSISSRYAYAFFKKLRFSI